MERRSSTRAGVLAWTPAPGHTSPPRTITPQRSWLEVEDKVFYSHMDENGIIQDRLGETSEDEACAVEDEDLLWDVGTPEPEDSPPRALDINCHLSELLESEPLFQSTGDDEQNGHVALGNWSGEEEGANLEEENVQSLKIYSPPPDSRTERAGVSGMTSDETVKGRVHKEQTFCLREGMNPQYDWKESQVDVSCGTMLKSHRADRKISETQTPSQNGCDDMCVLIEKRSVSPPLSSTGTPHASAFSCLPLFSSEERTSNCDAEPFSEHVFADSIPEPHSHQFSHALRPYQPVRHDEELPEVDATPLSTTNSPGSKIQPGRSNIGKEGSAELERHTDGRHHSRQQPSLPCPWRTCTASQQTHRQRAEAKTSSRDSSPLSTPHHRQHRSHRAPETSHTDLKDVRKGQLSHPLPDFAKVEPRVRFPKNSYKPPMSGKPPRPRDTKPEAPLVFKSPADIVREVLLSSTEGLLDTPGPAGSHRPQNSALPEEFRCPLKASALVQQLQEDYNRLLTKYAEAENTIDRLRLEAKVNLYSDPPKPNYPALRGVLQEGSKVMTLSFPQAQRAELGTNAIRPTQQTFGSESIRGTPTHPSVHYVSSRQSDSLPAAQLVEAFTKQMQRFHLQIDEFEELMKKGRLKPYEQMEALVSLAQGQDTVERDYLASREQELQRRKLTGDETSLFDSDRELEGLIFQSGVRLEELREWVEQNQPVSEPIPSPPPPAYQLGGPLKETEPQPEDPASVVRVEVSPVSDESDGNREENKKELLSSLSPPLHHKHQQEEKDFSSLMDHYQNYRKVPEELNRYMTKEARDTLEFRDSPLRSVRTAGAEEALQWKTNDEQDSSKPVQLLPRADSPPGPSQSTQVANSMETLPGSVLPGQQASGRRTAGSRKSSSNLGETVTMEKKTSKGCTRILGAPPQDGVRSPETDSGFVGSDSSRVTPATCSPIQKRAEVRVTKPSVTNKYRVKSEAVSLSEPPEPSFPAHTQTSSGHSAHCASPAGGAPDSTDGRGEAWSWHPPSARPSCARRPARSLQPSPSSSVGSAHSLSEEEMRHGDHYAEPTNPDTCFRPSSSPTLPYHYGNLLTPQSSAQLTNRQDALQSLQVEVDRLRESLEGALRMAVPVRSVKVPPPALEDFRVPAQHHAATARQRCFRSLERGVPSKRQPRDGVRREGAEVTRTRRRCMSVPRLRPQLEITTDSEHAHSEPNPWTSKHIPVSPAASTDPGTDPRLRSHQRSTSSDGSEESDDDDDDEESKGPAPLCQHCVTRRTRPSARPVRKVGSLSYIQPCSNRCPLCGAPEPKRTRVPPPDQNSTQREARPLINTHKEKRGVFLAAAPPPAVLGGVPVLQCVPVCSSILYCPIPATSSSHPKPLYLPRSEDGGHRSRVRGHHRRSPSLGTWLAPSGMWEVRWHPARYPSPGQRPLRPAMQPCTQ